MAEKICEKCGKNFYARYDFFTLCEDCFAKETGGWPRCKKCGKMLTAYEKNQKWSYCQKCGLENYIQKNHNS